MLNEINDLIIKNVGIIYLQNFVFLYFDTEKDFFKMRDKLFDNNIQFEPYFVSLLLRIRIDDYKKLISLKNE